MCATNSDATGSIPTNRHFFLFYLFGFKNRFSRVQPFHYQTHGMRASTRITVRQSTRQIARTNVIIFCCVNYSVFFIKLKESYWFSGIFTFSFVSFAGGTMPCDKLHMSSSYRQWVSTKKSLLFFIFHSPSSLLMLSYTFPSAQNHSFLEVCFLLL